MKQRFGLMALLVGSCLVGGAASASEAPAAAAPRLEIDKPILDLGDVVRGQVATAVFELRNAGDAVLRVLNVKPG